MKKISLLLLLGSLLLCGCKKNVIYDYAKNNISEARYNLYAGQSEEMKVTFMSGKREKDYVINGYSTDLINFGIITFDINENVELPEELKFVLTVGTNREEGILERNPFDGTFVCDIKKIINYENDITAKLIAGNFVKEVKLHQISNNFKVDWNEALKVACENLETELKYFIYDDIFKGECYIKIINDNEINDCYYWYVNFVDRNGKNLAVIIDPNSKEVLARKIV